MFNPTLLMEKVVQAQQNDRLREAETARLLKEIERDTWMQKTKLTVALSGTVLIALMVAQML